ncbi:MAG: endonuclease/exonuclease/phosphatase family protein, partial [Sedimentisphaerales bacterium]|nr:endonuclease/exonuclease/phosphatase family protein [Sedimentisphaerales bacterium]
MLNENIFKSRFQQIALGLLCLGLGQVQAAEQIKVMSFNVWTVEGTQTGRDHIVNIVNASGADVVGFQELSDPGLIANALGWHLHTQSNASTNIISRYPILESSPARWGAKLQLPSGKTAWVFNTHLPAYPYQPYDLRDNTLAKNEAAVISSATSARGSQVTAVINDITAINAVSSGEMVFLTGDFNEPSHLDWTQGVADSTARSYDLKVQWPASSRIAAIGLTDSLRQISPDPVSDKSYSWTPRPEANEVHDRIDIVYYAGAGVTPQAVANIGPADGNADTDIVYNNYPSDHRAVVATFSYAAQPVEAGENILTTLELADGLALNGTVALTGSSLSINWQAFSVSAGGVLTPASSVSFTDSQDPATTISV